MMDKEIIGNVFLSLGSNLGDRRHNLLTAVEMIGEQAGAVCAVSPVYDTEPWGFVSEAGFLNMVLQIDTGHVPQSLMNILLGIERSIGRIRKAGGYASRIIDIDILFYNDICLDTRDLVIPHPHLHERRFVLAPLADIAPEFIHPVLGKTILSLLVSCSDSSDVRKSEDLSFLSGSHIPS